MTRPLRSASTAPSRGFPTTTSRSDSASCDGTHCLAGQRLAPSRRPPRCERQCRDTPSHVQCKSSRPDSRRLHAGHHLASQRFSRQAPPSADQLHPGLEETLLSRDTSAAIPRNGDSVPSIRSSRYPTRRISTSAHHRREQRPPTPSPGQPNESPPAPTGATFNLTHYDRSGNISSKFAVSVSYSDALACGYSRRLKPCRRAFVSNLCHFLERH